MIGPGFRLAEATAPERMARDRLTFDAWGGRLSLAQYLDRERTLRQTDQGRLGMHSWVLRLTNGVVVASCETFRLPLLPTGAIEVIASVYVDRALRGVRMASRLLAALVEHRKAAGLDGLVLFSEVGSKLYEHAGFRLLPAPTRRIPAKSGPGAPTFTRESLPEHLAHRHALREGRIDLHLLPTIVDWHLERSRFYARTLNRLEKSSTGARDGDVVAFWAPDFKHGVLRVLEASGPAGSSLEGVLASAADEAARLGLEAVEHWDDAHSRDLRGPAAETREDDLPMGLSFTPRGELFLGPLSRACWA